MIDEKELETMQFEYVEFPKKGARAYVTSEDMKLFSDNDMKLADKIRNDVFEYQENYKMKTIEKTLEQMSADTMISVAYLKKAMNNVVPSREFLYMYTVGLKKFRELDRTKAKALADTYFELKGGPLNSKCKEDYICLCAIRDNDDIKLFYDQCKEYTKLPFIRKERAANKRIEAEFKKKGF